MPTDDWNSTEPHSWGQTFQIMFVLNWLIVKSFFLGLVSPPLQMLLAGFLSRVLLLLSSTLSKQRTCVECRCPWLEWKPTSLWVFKWIFLGAPPALFSLKKKQPGFVLFVFAAKYSGATATQDLDLFPALINLRCYLFPATHTAI